MQAFGCHGAAGLHTAARIYRWSTKRQKSLSDRDVGKTETGTEALPYPWCLPLRPAQLEWSD